jgi:ATP-dependent helicase/nuclease subunit A
MTRARDRLIMTYASKRLQKDLADIVQRMDMGGEQLLIREAVCPGEWVLLTALQKTEAGELFALAGKPRNTQSGPYPWKIRVATAPQPVVDNVTQEKTEHISPDLYDKIQKGLSFHYLFAAATSTPSKQTATGLKGRWIDQEAAEDTIVPQTIYRNWRQPTFVSQSKQGKDYGNALHTAMQYIDYTACIHEEAVRAELKRLTDQGYLSAQQAELVDESKIACFFATALGQQLQGGNVVREFKFSLLMPADAHGEGLEAEQILLQGVVDCALLEDDGITIIDFKTDHVTEDSLPHKLAQYAPQVQIYAQAMQRIYQKPIKQRLLYFFSIGRFVCV